MKIIKVWVYKKSEGEVRYDVLTKSRIAEQITVRGDFEYYETDGVTVRKATRKLADEYTRNTGEKVELYIGYPAFMYDMGYRA